MPTPERTTATIASTPSTLQLAAPRGGLTGEHLVHHTNVGDWLLGIDSADDPANGGNERFILVCRQ